jgi:hypothetical protein
MGGGLGTSDYFIGITVDEILCTRGISSRKGATSRGQNLLKDYRTDLSSWLHYRVDGILICLMFIPYFLGWHTICPLNTWMSDKQGEKMHRGVLSEN